MNRPRDRASAAGQLKRCPFCGAGKHVELWDRFDGGYIAHVHCESCGADGPSIYSEFSADVALKRARWSWNGRSVEMRT